MNHKAISLPFLATTILAIIIFGVTIFTISKAFAASKQAQENFPNFIQALEEFSASTKEKDNFLLIIDQGSFLALFKEAGTVEISSTEKKVPAGRVPVAPTITTKKVFNSPPECTGYPCACLCREFEEEESSAGNINIITYSCSNLRCQKLEAAIQQNWARERGEDDPRRYSLQLQKENGLIAISAR